LAYHHRCEQGAQTNYICNGTCLLSRVLSVCRQKFSFSDVKQVYRLVLLTWFARTHRFY
jgi:hypothetical protein